MAATDDDITLPGETSIVVESAVPKTGPDAAKKAADEAKLKILRKQLALCKRAETHYRKEALDDMKFRAGTWGTKTFQWPDGISEKRVAQNRPCLTINRMPSFIRQVTNQARAAHLRIQVNPVDDRGDPKIAEVLQGIIRNIETKSFADRAYNMASDKQAEIGRGYFRIVTEWLDEKSFRQRLRIKREVNPFAIYVDPAHQEPDASDADWALKVTDLDEQQYEGETGAKPPTPATFESMGGEGDESGDWFPNGKIRVVQWFNREARGEKKHLALMDDGQIIPYPTDEQKVALEEAGAKILRERWIQPKVMVWRKCDACTILEETVWCTDQQPWVPVLGDEYIIEGEKDYRGVVRDSKEPARIYNVLTTGLVENVGLGAKAPVVGIKGQFGAEGSETRKAWKTANTEVHAFLEVEPMDIDGKAAPFPQRQTFEVPIEQTVVGIHQVDNDYKSTAGFFDASLGERGPQESGKAILARQKQDELGSSHYLDNLRYALCSAGAQLVKAIRVVYDEAQVVRITGNDERPRKVMVFSGAKNDPRLPQYNAGGPFQLPKGVTEIYDLSIGEYDVEVSAGPSSGTRRQEAAEALGELLKSLPPEIAVKFLDLYFVMLDFPKAQQLAERAKLLLPPEMQDPEDGDPMAQVPPQIRMQLAGMKKQLDQAMELLQKADSELKSQLEKAKLASETTLKKTTMETQSRERIASAARSQDMVKTAAQLQADQALADIEAVMEQIKFVLTQHHEKAMQQHQTAHDVGMAHLAHEHASEAAASEQAHTVAQAGAADVVEPPEEAA